MQMKTFKDSQGLTWAAWGSEGNFWRNNITADIHRGLQEDNRNLVFFNSSNR